MKYTVYFLSLHRTQQVCRIESLNPPGHPVTAAVICDKGKQNITNLNRITNKPEQSQKVTILCNFKHDINATAKKLLLTSSCLSACLNVRLSVRIELLKFYERIYVKFVTFFKLKLSTYYQF